MRVVGKKYGSFTDKNGEVIEFGQLHCIADFEESKSKTIMTEGEEAIVIKLTVEEVKVVPVGSEVSVTYNRYGKVVGVEVLNL